MHRMIFLARKAQTFMISTIYTVLYCNVTSVIVWSVMSKVFQNCDLVDQSTKLGTVTP